MKPSEVDGYNIDIVIAIELCNWMLQAVLLIIYRFALRSNLSNNASASTLAADCERTEHVERNKSTL